jgi:hypothetical protein
MKPQDEMIKGNLQSKYLEGYFLCCDAFGDMPIWSLMHPEKEAEDYYIIKAIDFTVDKDHDLINLLERLAKIEEMCFMVYIYAEIKYRVCHWSNPKDKYDYIKIIEEIKIDKIEIENDKEKGQP